MGRWLFKSEPSCYSFDDLRRDGSTVWDGITNAMARIHLRNIRRGDQVFFYHTGNVKAVVGVMKATSGPQSDPNADDDKAVAIEVKPVRALRHPVSLSRIKAEPKLASWDLVRQSRLSVMPVTEAQWQVVEELARESGD